MRYLFVLLLTTALLSCDQNHNINKKVRESISSSVYNQDDGLVYEEEMEANLQEFDANKIGDVEGNEEVKNISKIIRTGNINIKVQDLEGSKNGIDNMLGELGAYYENEHYNGYKRNASYSLVIRVPNSKFDTLIHALEVGEGKVQSKSISVRDVSEEYVDLGIRLENNLAYLAQYQQLLKKAKTINEILQVQEKIRRLETEIDSKKGRMKYLDNQVSYSTLRLELIGTSKEISSSESFLDRVGSAFCYGYQSFLNFLIRLVHLWPYVIVGLMLFLFRNRILKAVRRKF